MEMILGTTTSTPMVRMDFDPTIGIEENNVNIQVGSVYPNLH